MSCHLPGIDFGMMPNGLTWMPGHSSGPTILPSAHSFPKYFSTAAACSWADGVLPPEDLRGLWRSKPTLKPSRMPCINYCEYSLSGCETSALSHSCNLSGVTILKSGFGVGIARPVNPWLYRPGWIPLPPLSQSFGPLCHCLCSMLSSVSFVSAPSLIFLLLRSFESSSRVAVGIHV